MIKRRLIVALLTVLGIYACDNNIADIGQNLIYDETYVEVQRHELNETYIVRLDSFPTSSLSTLTLGRIKDPVTGLTTATPYFQLYRASWDKNLTVDVPAVFDSLTLNFSYKKTLAGDTTKIQKYSVYRLKDYPLLDVDDPYQYNNQKWPYDPDSCLGTKSIYPQYDFVKKEMPYIKLNTPYGEALGKELFERMKAQDPIFGGNAGSGTGSGTGDYLPFLRFFKGLVIVPSEENNLLASISADSLFLRCHYSIGEKALYFDMPVLSNQGGGSPYAFTNIEHEPTDGLKVNNRPLGFNDTLSFYKNNMGVIQGLSSYMLKIQLPYIKDVNVYRTIIKAEVELETVHVEDLEIPQAQTLGVYVMDTEGHIDYVLSNATGDTPIYGYLKQDATKPDRYSYVIDITDYYISMVENIGVPLHQSLQLLIGLPGTLFKNHIDKTQLINGENSTTFSRAIFEKVPSLNLYYIEYK